MKFRALLFISFFPLFLNGMELIKELNSLAECTEQEEWQSPVSSGWKPWESAMPSIADHYKSASYLLAIPECYEKIRQGAFDEPEIYTPTYLTQRSKEHVMRLKLIIKKFDWPTKENFGKKCAQGAWLIAQHANHDPDFQQIALHHLGKLKNKSGLQQYAYLLDKMQVNRGEPQHYGTQVDSNGKTYPIQGYSPNPANWPETVLQLEVINNRRTSARLPNLQEDQEKLRSFFDSLRLFTSWQLALLSN